ncbi:MULTISPECIES: hypothetical protein [Pseudomonas]|uniref:hypothetical protein n=1 Tax=Pseudomonas TaxID=286 RepID=UPI0021572327|nr:MULTISPECIES: hypothetical protein [Pseudomonas]MCZ9666399.1 hypothetical protein [Pseudomonas aeruginosa]
MTFSVSKYKEKAPQIEAVEFRDMADAGLLANFAKAESFNAHVPNGELTLSLSTSRFITLSVSDVLIKSGEEVSVMKGEDFYKQYEPA